MHLCNACATNLKAFLDAAPHDPGLMLTRIGGWVRDVLEPVPAATDDATIKIAEVKDTTFSAAEEIDAALDEIAQP